MTDLNAQETRATVRVDKVSHFFGEGGSRNRVLFDNSIEIEAGQLVIMTGPSGIREDDTADLDWRAALGAVRPDRNS